MSTLGLHSQTQRGNEAVAIHLRGGLGFLRHSTSVSGFDGIVDCGTYTGGSGLTPQFSLSLERVLSERLTFGLGGRWTTRNVSLGAAQTSLPAFDVSTQTPASVVFENTLAARLPYVDVVPEFSVDLLSGGSSRVRATAGAVIGLPLKPTYEITQRIVSPDNAVYKINRQQSISLSDGERALGQIASPLVAVAFGLENMLDAGSGRHFTQGIRLEYTVTDVVTSGSWKAFGVRADIGYRFGVLTSPGDVREPAPAPPTPPPPPPMIVNRKPMEPTPLPVLTVRIDSLALRLQTGNELRASLPLVNAVFFDLNSSVIPQRYRLRAADVVVSDNAVDHHRNILLSIARIMNENSRATIVVEGATSGSDESQGLTLAKERTDNVLSALASLGVAKERMSART
ncbi:MAG: OmpA family protein, partial [Candidatus Kapaibacterium sp.]